MIEWKEFDNLEESDLEFLKNIADDLGSARACFDLAQAYLYTRDCPGAVRYAEKALELDPDNKALYYEFLAHAHQRAEAYADAITWLDKLTRLPDPESQHFLDLFELYLRIGDLFSAHYLTEHMEHHVPRETIEKCRKRTRYLADTMQGKPHSVTMYTVEWPGIESWRPFYFEDVRELKLYLIHALKWKYITKGSMSIIDTRYTGTLDTEIPVVALTLDYLKGTDVCISRSDGIFYNKHKEKWL